MCYLHGGDIYRNNVKYDFSVNTNPLGMPKKSIEAAHRGIELSSNYPDYRNEELSAEIAKSEGVQINNVIAGNGASQLIYAICHSLRVEKGLVYAPCFSEYERAVKSAGGEVIYYDLKEENNFELKEDFIEKIDTDIDIVFICNPNNPTGNIISKELITKILEKCEITNTFLCVDECFLSFLEDENEITLKKEIFNYPHLIVLRALTKIYAMAGLRLGYILSDNKELLCKLNKTIPPWSVSLPAQLAGIEALKDNSYIEKTLDYIEKEKQYLLNELSLLTEKIYGSSANFIFFKSDEGLYENMLKKGILIRDCSNFVNLKKGYYRIAVKTHSENTEFIKCFREIKEV